VKPMLIPAEILKVIDADTLRVKLNGKQETVRLIGIDCPEPDMPNHHKANYLTHYYLNQNANQIYLEAGGKNRDNHGRLRRYVWLQPPKKPLHYREIRDKMLNAILLANNCATLMPIGKNNPAYTSAFRFIYKKTKLSKGK